MTLADIIIPLCGSISNERAQKIREACDMQERRVEALEKRVEALSLDVAILVEGTVEAVHEAGLRTLAQRVEALEQIRISHEADYSKSASVLADRIEALDRALSAAAEDNGDLDVRVPALERASAKNTGEGEVEHAASVSRSVSAKDASRATTPNNAEEGASAMRHGSGARPDATSLSTACPLCHGMLSEDECKKQNTPSPRGSTASASRDDVLNGTQPLTGGEGVPLKVAESFSKPGDYIVWCGIRGIATFHGPDAKANAETFASRAPRPVSVEEMAERLRVARNAWAGYAPGVVISPSDCWLALDRAAIGGGG